MIALLLSVLLAGEPDPRENAFRAAAPEWLVLLHHADALRLDNRTAEALKAYEHALRAARLTELDDPAVAIVLHNTGFFHHQAGRVLEAERLYNQSYQWFAAHQPEYAAPLVRVVTNLAVIYAETGRFAKAEARLRPWLAIAEERESDSARLRGVLASVLARQHKYDEAEPMMDAVRAAIEREPKSELQQESLALTISNLAAVYQATGRGPLALAAYDEALAILTALPNHRPVALVRTWHEAAMALMAADQNQRALAIYKKAIEVSGSRISPNHPLMATVLDGYAALLRKLGKGGEANKLERRAEAVRQRHEQENLLGHTIDVQSLH